jgi:hypothetical protein
MKLMVPAALALALFSGAGGTGPLKDSLGNLLTWKDDLGRMRAQVADLRHGRGAAAPEWVSKYANAICAMDAAFVVEHTDGSLGLTEEAIAAQFTTLVERGMDCSDVRYLGSVGDTQYAFVLRQGPKDVWYLLTVAPDTHTVLRVD